MRSSVSDVGGLERKPRGNERVKVQSFFSREASLASLSEMNRHLGNIVFVNGRKSIEKCRTEVHNSPEKSNDALSFKESRTSENLKPHDDRTLRIFSLFHPFFYFLMLRRCAVTSLLSFEQRTSSAAV